MLTPDAMKTTLDLDLDKLRGQAFDRLDWGEPALRRYHAALAKLDAEAIQPLHRLYQWLLVPTTLWPFDVQSVLMDCLAVLKSGKTLDSRQQLLLDLLPEAPDEKVCTTVIEHEHHVHKGQYEHLVNTHAKFAQNEIAMESDPDLQKQWDRIKKAFPTEKYCDHKGVIRRTMTVERNLHPSHPVELEKPESTFQAVFDAFCLRWNLFGMQHDHPLLLKLAVNLTPYGTMIHIPAYWSFDQKRDLCWGAIAKLHRGRVAGRQGEALAGSLSDGLRDAKKLVKLDKQALEIGLKGHKRHAFLCKGLGWNEETSAKRITRLRSKFKKQMAA